ncbi:unannotated protein [freshwater metagenome]|uniref:Unannotated protein n=1 Tax=freshwater metagenome TaxID=449393 RepID=A0A6J7TQM7_9ZZZZ
MKGRNPDGTGIAQGVGGRELVDQLHHTFAHFTGGFVGERDSQDLMWFGRAGGQQVRDSPGEHPSLSGASAGDDEQGRTGVRHRITLRRVQTDQ